MVPLLCRHRFAMPNPLDSTASDLYYSWNLGPIHVISYNTEVFFFPDVYSHADMRRQYEWLEQVQRPTLFVLPPDTQA